LIRIISFTDLLLAASSRCVRSLERCRLLPNHLLQARTQYDYTLHDRSRPRRPRPRRRPMPFVVLVFVLCPSSHPHLMRATISSRACWQHLY